MAIASLTIGGFTYDVACRDGGEVHLTALAAIVDTKVQNVRASVGAINENRQLLMAALLLADERQDALTGDRAAPPLAETDTDPALDAIALRLERLATRLEKSAGTP